MKNINIIVILSLLIIIITFLLGFSVASSNSKNEDNITISTYTKDKGDYAK